MANTTNKSTVFQWVFLSHLLYLKYLNSLEKEVEKIGINQISFLDMKIIKNQDNSISIDLYKKETFSGRYVNYLSSHPIGLKICIVKSLIDKVYKLSDPQFHHKNITALKRDLLLNNYPISFINKHIKNKYYQYKNENNNNNNGPNNGVVGKLATFG